MSDTALNTVQKLRPKKLIDYIGQLKVVENLKMFVDAVKKRGGPTEHILFYGPSGTGKTTLSNIIANELGSDIKITSGAVIEKAGDLAAILTNLNDKDVLFIDEIHRLPKTVEEVLYPVMEEFALDIIIGKGPSARTVRLSVPHITIVGATTKLANLSTPLRERFGLLLRLDYYSEEELKDIIKRSAKLLKFNISKEAADSIAKRSRGTPRIAIRILNRVRDLIETSDSTEIDVKVLDKLFALMELDDLGLSNIDRKYLMVLGKKYKNNPLGVETIASSLSEDKKTIEEFVEPYLLQIGFIKKTNRGRVLTNEALSHIGEKTKKSATTQEKLI
ncbi:MAG: Holliday junction branch migration DNA helicase RuvB [Patescibacteria group bacterium]